MKFLLKSVIILLVAVILLSVTYAEDFIQPGEELTYEVSYMGIKLGTVKIVTESNQTLNNVPVYKTKAFIKSYPSIPFVGIDVIYQTWIDKSVTFTRKFVGNYNENGDWTYQEIIFDYVNNKISEQRFKDNKQFFSKSTNINKKWNDGLSLFFLARKYSQSNKSLKVPTFVDDTLYTTINFSGKKENVEISSSNYPIRTNYFSGNAGFKGVYGLSGGFEGWFSDDNARVPIKAKMKVIIGTVNIELIQWRRNNWQPPKGN
jgi:hypothetical protein